MTGTELGELRLPYCTNLIELVDVVAAFEDGLASEQLGENAPDAPHVDACGLGTEQARKGMRRRTVKQMSSSRSAHVSDYARNLRSSA